MAIDDVDLRGTSARAEWRRGIPRRVGGLGVSGSRRTRNCRAAADEAHTRLWTAEAGSVLLCSLEPDLASVRGVPVRLEGVLHLAVMALAVALSAVTVGAILSTALLIGPAAIALHLARRPGTAVILAAGIGVAATWGGIVLAYDSYAWTGGHGWPVSFCIVALIFGGYLLASRTAPRGAGHRAEAA